MYKCKSCERFFYTLLYTDFLVDSQSFSPKMYNV